MAAPQNAVKNGGGMGLLSILKFKNSQSMKIEPLREESPVSSFRSDNGSARSGKKEKEKVDDWASRKSGMEAEDFYELDQKLKQRLSRVQ
jgi:hypothetical protein